MPDEAPRFELALQFTASDKAAIALSDFMSIQVDLGHIINACEWLLHHLPNAPEEMSSVDTTLTRAVWESAVITYGRCFHSGKGHITGLSRTRFPADIMRQLSGDQRVTDKAVMEERDRHAAHRVNLRQRAQALVALTNPPAPPGVDKVMAVIVHQVVDHDMPERLLQLAIHLAERMKVKIGEQRDLVVAEWEGRLEEAYAIAKREPPTINLGGPSMVSTSIFDLDD
jgi:hypothetical protein